MSTLPSGAIKRYIAGQITATGATEATLTVNTLEADSVIILSLNTVGGTPAAPYVFSKNTTTNTIGIKSGASDTSVYDVVVFA
jgi:hypothetical protein